MTTAGLLLTGTPAGEWAALRPSYAFSEKPQMLAARTARLLGEVA